MMLRPTFSYYGSKWRIALRYPPPLDNGPIIEPFAGAAGYAHRWDDGKREVLLYDVSPAVISAWTWFLSVTPAEIRGLPLLDAGRMPAELPTEARAFIGFWCGYALSEPRTSLSPNVEWHKYPRKCWTVQTREHVAKNREIMGQRWRFIAGSYDTAADQVGTWFVDPPYNNRAGGRYRYRDLDYVALADWCRTRSGRVIACENVGANWLPFEYNGPQVGARFRSLSREAIWTSDRSGQQMLSLQMGTVNAGD